MNNFYNVILGNIKGEKRKYTYLIDTYKIFINLFRIIAFCISIIITHRIFEICITVKTLQNTIALGSIFATFGSAIVAVASLYCNDCYMRFSDNVCVLQNDLLKDEKWTRWSFIKRRYRRKLLDSGNYVQVLTNAKIEFYLGSHTITITIPTIRADFDDLPIFRQFFLMKKYSKQYETNLCNHVTADESDAFLMWDCIYDIYKHIVYYKICTYIIWIGCSFIMSSLIFSFLYIYI